MHESAENIWLIVFNILLDILRRNQHSATALGALLVRDSSNRKLADQVQTLQGYIVRFYAHLEEAVTDATRQSNASIAVVTKELSLGDDLISQNKVNVTQAAYQYFEMLRQFLETNDKTKLRDQVISGMH